MRHNPKHAETDDQVHGFGDREILLIVAGPHGYISPSWYTPGDTPAPTWNFSVAHCYGVPEILDPEENLRVLTRLVAHFERHVEQLRGDGPYASPALAADMERALGR